MESDIFPVQEKYVVCVGRLNLMKRIDTVLDAFCTVIDRTEYNLVIVGDGNARKALETQAKALAINESVIFTGRLDNPFPLLKSAAAFVLASEYEGFSNSALEAMFCNVPVITSFCSTDACEMCEQGAALGFKVGDASQLAEHITAVATDENLSQKLVNRAREYCNPHTIAQAIPVYEDLIRRVAEPIKSLIDPEYSSVALRRKLVPHIGDPALTNDVTIGEGCLVCLMHLKSRDELFDQGERCQVEYKASLYHNLYREIVQKTSHAN